MSLSISIRFLTGRAHLHPWQTHHNEGRVEWPPSLWRLLRALVAVAGRGLTTLPAPDFVFQSKPPKALKNRRRKSVNEEHPTVDLWQDQQDDCLKGSRLMALLAELRKAPTIWLPKTAGGHTRQYFPIHEGGVVRPTGSAVFDSFATVRKDQPLVFHWPDVNLDPQPLADLNLILSRMTYFGRAESWCRADAHTEDVKGLPDVVTEGAGQTHWCCVCLEDAVKPDGKEYRDYTLERRLAPCKDVRTEVKVLFPRTKPIATESRPADGDFQKLLEEEPAALSLLRCLLRESGHDIKDGLERPIGTRWVHYAVPRAIYNVPRPSPQPRPRDPEAIDLVVYALNTATVHRPVLPPRTDTLLIADRFRSAVMALRRLPSQALSGHEANGEPCMSHDHAFWWPMDDDDDGFIDHVYVWARGGFQNSEADALRRLNRLRQRGGRPDLLVSPIFVGRAADYRAWQSNSSRVFVSATPYFCPLHLGHGQRGGRRIRPIKPVILKSLESLGIFDVDSIEEISFDSDGNPVFSNPDLGFPFGRRTGHFLDQGIRFLQGLSYCRRRRGHEVRGPARMLRIRFGKLRSIQPFAIGSQSHFGLGLFVPEEKSAIIGLFGAVTEAGKAASGSSVAGTAR